MADKTPIKAIFSGSDPTALAEFEAGDTIPITAGGTGRIDGGVGGFKNRLINGCYRLWQRGTTLSAATGVNYLADRWSGVSNGSTIAQSLQSFTLGQTAVPGDPLYYVRCVVASSAGASNYAIYRQRIEYVSTLAGKSATVSFYAKADTTRNIAVGLEQSFGTGGSPSTLVTAGVSKFAISNVWAKYTVTIALPSVSGKTLGSNGNDSLDLMIWMDAGSSYDDRTNTLGQQSGTFEFARAQLEEGTLATEWEERPPSAEYLLALRYCWGIRGSGGNATGWFGVLRSGAALISGNAIIYPVEMRAAPVLSGVSSWATSAPSAAGQVAGYIERTAAYSTITGALSTSSSAFGTRKATIVLSAATSFSGTAGDVIQVQAYRPILDAEL